MVFVSDIIAADTAIVTISLAVWFISSNVRGIGADTPTHCGTGHPPGTEWRTIPLRNIPISCGMGSRTINFYFRVMI